MAKKILQSFNQTTLEELRRIRRTKRERDGYESFWKELNRLLFYGEPPEEWKKMDKDDVVLGEVWQQQIGEVFYKHKVHKFSYLYVETQGLAIDSHGHEEPANNGKQIRKLKEWYFFPDGRMEFCDKDGLHRLVNNYGHPIYVLSIKVGGKGNR